MKQLLIVLFLFATAVVQAQDWRKQADSLLQVYQTQTSPARQVECLTRASLIFLFHNPDTALLLSSQAEQIALAKNNDTLLALAYTSKSAVYVIMDNNTQTLAYAHWALDISERTPLPADILASIYRKLGYVYRNQNNDSGSVAAYKKALAYSAKVSNLHDMSATASNLGQLLGKIKQYDSALYYHQYALGIAKKEGFADIAVRCFINIMNVYKAKPLPDSAFAIVTQLEPWLLRAEVTPIVKGLAYTSIADLDLQYGKTNRLLAARYLDSMQQLLKITKPGTDNMVDFYLNRALYLFSAGQYDSASAALVQYHGYKTKKDSEIIEGHAQDMAAKYETGKKEVQIKTLDAESRRRKQLLFVFGGIAAIFLGMLLMVWRQNRKIRRQEQKLGFLMKELHHRVKNNLQIVSSLLSIQQIKIEDKTAQKALQEGQYRIDAMSLIHKKLYQTDAVNSVNIKEYITELCENLLHAYGYNSDNFALQLDVQVKALEPDMAIPAGLILNEVVTNAMKYAFAGVAQPALRVSLHNEADNLVLLIADNGTAFTEEKWKQSHSFGKQLIQSLAGQLRGKMQLSCANGTCFTFTFPYQPFTT